GRITKEDVQGYVKSELAKPKSAAAAGTFAFPEMPAIDFSKFGTIETRALSRIKKLSGANLHRNWVGIPHVTQND
ncbi:branched-chain alpha-keto acid dehydrogenase subunit E2, partial [Vibrio cholerae]|nr:branched-chain alpha-keto acid dehydrogenase subunit E2 [Vibrio cholerae]